MTNLRMQLPLRQTVDALIHQGWEVVSRSPVLVVQRGVVRKEVWTTTGGHVVADV